MKRSSVFVLCLVVLLFNGAFGRINRDEIIGKYRLVPEKTPFYKKWLAPKVLTSWNYNYDDNAELSLFSDSTFTDVRRDVEAYVMTYSGKWKIGHDSVILYDICFRTSISGDTSSMKLLEPANYYALKIRSHHRLKILHMETLEEGRFLQKE